MKLLDHFLVFRCIGCDDALPAGELLCAECQAAFREECNSPCKYCHGKHIQCGCFANGRKSPASRVIHIAPYRAKGVTHNMIYCCKSTRDKFLMSFMASLVSAEIENRLSPTPETVIVPIPRSRDAILENGFDQSVIVAKAAADSLSIPCLSAIKHCGKKKQKLLGYRDRLHNAKEAFVINEEYADGIRGKRVILYDDIITTGASAAACISLLKKSGATGVDFVSFARTEK